MVEESDQVLIRNYLAGDDNAFERLYQRYRRSLYAYLRTLLPPSDVDDAFQQTWLKVCAGLPRYRPEGKFPAWLLRIGRNAALDALRKRSRRREICVDATPESDWALPVEPWREMAETELQHAIAGALAEMSPEQRAVFQMRSRKISFRLIAARQECRVNTAVMRMRYAMAKLRKHLERG